MEIEMLSRAAIVGALILSASCNKTESGDVIGSAPSSGSGSPTKPGSGGGFSSDLARELGSGGSAPAAGSVGAKVAGDPPKAGNLAPTAGSDAVALAGNAAQPEPALKAGAKPEAKPEAKPDPAPPPSPGTPASAPRTPPEAHGPVKVPADLAAIKLAAPELGSRCR